MPVDVAPEEAVTVLGVVIAEGASNPIDFPGPLHGPIDHVGRKLACGRGVALARRVLPAVDEGTEAWVSVIDARTALQLEVGVDEGRTLPQKLREASTSKRSASWSPTGRPLFRGLELERKLIQCVYQVLVRRQDDLVLEGVEFIPSDQLGSTAASNAGPWLVRRSTPLDGCA
jgi:hypothetical protein